MNNLIDLIKKFPDKYYTTKSNTLGINKKWVSSNFNKIWEYIKRNES